jgi:N6-adenosine-specific RNA methylase IME4
VSSEPFAIIPDTGEVIEFRRPDLGLPGEVVSTTRTSLVLRPDLSLEQWKRVGEQLHHIEHGHQWWIGDWWAYGEHSYGERKALTDSKDWRGPKFQACADAGTVCRAFETSRRREVVPFTHHREVAGLPAEEADELLDWCEREHAATGKVPPKHELRAEVAQRNKRRADPGKAGTGRIEDLHAAAEAGLKYGTIYADPPWLYGNQGTRAATSKHYDGMTVGEIAALPIDKLAADDAHLHLWTTNGFLFECPKIFDAWGFEFRSSFIWAKTQIGIGNYWRNSHEFLLTAIRGDAKRFLDDAKDMKSWVVDDNDRSWFECARGRHSAKPEQVRRMIERASPLQRLELFARDRTDGWFYWGNEVVPNLRTGKPVVPASIEADVNEPPLPFDELTSIAAPNQVTPRERKPVRAIEPPVDVPLPFDDLR